MQPVHCFVVVLHKGVVGVVHIVLFMHAQYPVGSQVCVPGHMPLTVQPSHTFESLQIGVAPLQPDSSAGSHVTQVPATHWVPFALPLQSVSPRHSTHVEAPEAAPSAS